MTVAKCYPLFFAAVAVIHLIWAVLLASSSAAGMATAPSYLLDWAHSRYILSALLVVASVMALLATFRTVEASPRMALLLAPQGALLLLGATGAVQAMMTSQFADGVNRPWAFIAADQMWAPVFAVCHQWALASTITPILRRVLWRG
mgnify:CR=1 FL=1